MFYKNSVDLIGRATRDAEIKNVGKDSKVATFRLVSNRRIKKRNDEYVEKATFVDCEAWGQRADYVEQYVKKGTPVFVQGQLETDEWETAEGQRRSKLKIYCNSVQVERPKDEPKDEGKSESAPAEAGQPVGAAAAPGSDDVPF